MGAGHSPYMHSHKNTLGNSYWKGEEEEAVAYFGCLLFILLDLCKLCH